MPKKTTKNRILQSALHLFARDGYEAVSMEQIASAVGIRAPSLYKHYKGKRDIFDSIVACMRDMDAEGARENGMPETTLAEDASAYGTTTVASIKAFTKAQFHHWTAEEFSSDFRKLLTLEQYRDPEMAALYRQYLSTGPLEYMKDVFSCMFGSPETAEQLSLAFYAPIYMLYGVYDGAEDRDAVLRMAERHIDLFFAAVEKNHTGETGKDE